MGPFSLPSFRPSPGVPRLPNLQDNLTSYDLIDCEFDRQSMLTESCNKISLSQLSLCNLVNKIEYRIFEPRVRTRTKKSVFVPTHWERLGLSCSLRKGKVTIQPMLFFILRAALYIFSMRALMEPNIDLSQAAAARLPVPRAEHRDHVRSLEELRLAYWAK